MWPHPLILAIGTEGDDLLLVLSTRRPRDRAQHGSRMVHSGPEWVLRGLETSMTTPRSLLVSPNWIHALSRRFERTSRPLEAAGLHGTTSAR
jgi:hypothetical protein